MNKSRLTFAKIPKAKWDKRAFILKLPVNADLLDIGCGNNSPKATKILRPDIRYEGIDVSNYNNTDSSIEMADDYMIVTAEEFPEGILAMGGGLSRKYDAVISSHNIEHCLHPNETIAAFCRKIRSGGKLYFSFPSGESIKFPSRQGTLNFYDDPTHIWVPKFELIKYELEKNEMKIIKAINGYKPPYYTFIGGVIEPISKREKRVMLGTWAYWGGESVIWAEKL